MLNFDGNGSIDPGHSTLPSNKQSQISFLMKKLPILKTTQKNQLLADEISAIMNLFCPQRGKSIRKENLRVSAVRNHKKLLRMIFYPKKHHHSYFKSIRRSRNADNCFQKFRDHSISNKELLMPICIPSFGPKSERKVLNESSNHNCSNSFNDFYLYNYFRIDEIKHSFLIYLDFLFADLDILKLSKELKLKCCGSLDHLEECRQKWDRLKNFFSIVMIDDLEERYKTYTQKSQDNRDPADIFLI